MNLCPCLTALAILFSTLSIASAQEIDLTTPQPEHELLERFSGVWDFEKRSVPADDLEPQIVGSGKVTAELLGGFFVVSRWDGHIYGIELIAVQVLGYDVGQQKYSGSWVDSIISYRWELSGSIDKETNELILVSSGPGPSGGTDTFRERYKIESADSIIIIAEMLREEEWVRFMTTHLTREK